jgi:hypothetical protein
MYLLEILMKFGPKGGSIDVLSSNLDITLFSV